MAQSKPPQKELLYMKPLIGLIPLFDEGRDSYWMLPGYMTGISESGGIPIMLPLEMGDDDICQAVNTFDGFLLTGGHDISPNLYNEEILPECGAICEARDHLEERLFAEARKQDKPILGICRGIQLINALLGGTLYQDICSQFVTEIEHHMQPPYDRPAHSISVVPGTPLYDLCGPVMHVNSYHHQAVRTLSGKLTAMAYAEDGIVEAVYDQNARFLWAVQFHPEFAYRADPDCLKIFEAFVNACRI